MRLEKYTVSTFDSPFKLGLYLPFHASLESNQRSLSRHNFHVLTFIRSIVSHFVYLSCRYRSREHEVEDDEYKKDASDCFVPHSFSSDVSRASGLDDEKSCNWGSQDWRRSLTGHLKVNRKVNALSSTRAQSLCSFSRRAKKELLETMPVVTYFFARIRQGC